MASPAAIRSGACEERRELWFKDGVTSGSAVSAYLDRFGRGSHPASIAPPTNVIVCESTCIGNPGSCSSGAKTDHWQVVWRWEQFPQMTKERTGIAPGF
ncbi:hypothetical protein GCM10010840_31860 [Deinococcus aerolatus]|uniref:Uncharacterized protein n=1 Tax=Deinococcus aerolatus TaxID=522487 RepID=A0ABQ2GF80_9DEIO|nr:hypothetical protein GCM10010840_31860 [Deinococcus aerolatus]